jgi:hypothetical protein
MGRNRFERGFGPVVRQTDNERVVFYFCKIFSVEFLVLKAKYGIVLKKNEVNFVSFPMLGKVNHIICQVPFPLKHCAVFAVRS